MSYHQIGSLEKLKRLIDDQESQGTSFQFRGWSIRLPNGDYVHGPYTEYGITTRRILVTQDKKAGHRIASENRGELVEFWSTPRAALAIARKGGEAIWWDAVGLQS